MSLNGKDALVGDTRFAKEVGLVSGDLIHVIFKEGQEILGMSCLIGSCNSIYVLTYYSTGQSYICLMKQVDIVY